VRRIARWGGICAFAVLAAACQEKLASPADCPELCPGTSLTIKDTTLTAIVGGDSSYSGYIGYAGTSALLVSDGLSAGEARLWAAFPKRPDSVTVDGTAQAFTTDSVAITLNLVARDSLVPALKLFVHRIPNGHDSTTTFQAIDTLLTAATLIDSILVPDTLKSGAVRVVLTGDALARIAPAEDDSGRISIGIRVRGSASTGVRFSTLGSTAGGPVLVTYGRAAVTDTAKQRQTLTIAADSANFVMDGPPDPPADQLFLGGRQGARTLIRFFLPKSVKDSAIVIRATLELTPSGPIKGLRNDAAALLLQGLLADLGPKSPPLSGSAASAFIQAGATAMQSIDVRSIVASWFAVSPAPTAFFIGISPEGGTFSRPEFYSTRSAGPGPRLRITYALPSRPGHP
jgi:hypothetical protein